MDLSSSLQIIILVKSNILMLHVDETLHPATGLRLEVEHLPDLGIKTSHGEFPWKYEETSKMDELHRKPCPCKL